ncbi:histamine H2 receptor [Biomphalaria glabrata]|uniref:Uncharacterized protein LOC106056154 n=1 Tax=Biomphalaria glabrata TaxID=6526 RepID=A0A2C9JGQ0_BIOGL|nr:uncharacterized protein LOC106056154 [Biomphalaria glabrata]KAI8753390.1 5-hydroxytryptamine receptor 4-like [Biomphalaria glabrata]
MTHLHNSSRDEAEVWLSSRGAAQGHAVDGPHIVAMDQRETQSQEAYYLFFVGSLGMALNILVITMIFIRRNLRRMTSAFLVHSGFLNLLKAGFCIPFGLNLLSEADEKSPPQNCRLQGSIYIVLVTTSAVNMVAMICTEAYTFGEINVGGNSHGTSCCIMFGLLVVYITSVILHLGPTLIGGAIKYNPHIGSCAFELGNITGYVANVMWIVIITLSFVGVGHFLSKLYKEIQLNKPNRVSMLVRHSITITEEMARKPSACTVQEMTQEAMHRAKIFVITAIAFALCWYPLFLLILIDMHFRVSPKVYQAFSFIAWTEALVEPIILICFDRNLNLLARFMYCDRDQFTAAQIAFLMAQHRQQQQQLHHHHHHLHHHHEDDDQVDASRQSSIDADDAFHCGAAHALGECSGCSTSGGEPHHHHHPADPGLPNSIVPCRHCCPTPPPPGETTPLRSHHHHHHRPHSPSGDSPACTSAHELRGFRDFQPHIIPDEVVAMEMNSAPFRIETELIARKQKDSASRQGDIQC